MAYRMAFSRTSNKHQILRDGAATEAAFRVQRYGRFTITKIEIGPRKRHFPNFSEPPGGRGEIGRCLERAFQTDDRKHVNLCPMA